MRCEGASGRRCATPERRRQPALARGSSLPRPHDAHAAPREGLSRAHMHALYRTEGVLHADGAADAGRRVVHRPGPGRWVREAGARAMRVWLRRRARSCAGLASGSCHHQQRLENQRRLSTNLNLVQGASRLERTLKVALLDVSDFPPNLARPRGSTKAPPRS